MYFAILGCFRMLLAQKLNMAMACCVEDQMWLFMELELSHYKLHSVGGSFLQAGKSSFRCYYQPISRFNAHDGSQHMLSNLLSDIAYLLNFTMQTQVLAKKCLCVFSKI